MKSAGKIRHYGVSNFDVDDLDELKELVPKASCAANQVQYNLSDRGIEFDLYPRCQKDGVAVMAYSPLGQGRLIKNPGLASIAQKAQSHERLYCPGFYPEAAGNDRNTQEQP